MATVMLMHWPEVTKEQYEQVRLSVNWEGDAPDGGKFHTAWLGSDGFHVLDLWESKEKFEAFVNTAAVERKTERELPRARAPIPLPLMNYPHTRQPTSNF